ncbi:MAG: electron transport complex subunit RsxC [Calditrichaeota bacterium]|nr:MAG: electron transport complex subunit RsxC [Calditrichota bacterium]
MGLFNTLPTFQRGIHPGDFKDLTRHLPIERMPFSAELTIPLSQHLGAPSKPRVKVGDTVQRGQLIAEPGGFVSIGQHAPVTGTVTAIEPRPHPTGRMVESIIIATDPFSPQTFYNEHPMDWEALSPRELISLIQHGGFVGLGGAAFPTHVKLSVPEGKHARFLIVNGVECEPYLTSDHRVMLEEYDDLFYGIRILQKILDVRQVYIGVENNKEDAIEVLRNHVPDDMACEVIALETKYPQGAEKMLIEAVLHREVPSGKLPIDVEVVVNNSGTITGIGHMFRFGQPLIERVVTVTGPGIKRPANVRVPIGTPLTELLNFCGGITDDTRQILFGGPMMGAPQARLDVPILKGTSGILCLTENEINVREEYPCIRCLRCVDVCPVGLNPSRLGALAKSRDYEHMLDFHVMDCVECGSCSYICPSNIPLVQRFRVAKGLLREQQARNKAS